MYIYHLHIDKEVIEYKGFKQIDYKKTLSNARKEYPQASNIFIQYISFIANNNKYYLGR